MSKAYEILPRRQMARIAFSIYLMDFTYEITNKICVVHDAIAHELITIPVVIIE